MKNNGITRIAAERKRQFNKHDFTADHDARLDRGELQIAANCYAAVAASQELREKCGVAPHDVESIKRIHFRRWPAACGEFNPSLDPLRNLEKAGALIAAAIDRRLEARRRLVIQDRVLGYHQESVLRELVKRGSWFPGAPQIVARTPRILETLVRRGLVMRGENGTYTPTTAGAEAVKI